MTLSNLNFEEIRIFEDCKDDLTVMRDIIGSEHREHAFYLLDVGNIIAKHKNWISKMPRVVPHYAIKCNPNPTVIKVLAALHASFDCASQHEIETVMQFGVPAERIIVANPVKTQSDIRFAKRMGVDKMTVDNKSELMKIKDLFPKAKLVIRFCCDAAISEIVLSSKFGCDPDKEAIELIQATKDLGLQLHGFAFHVGSPCGEAAAYGRGIQICKKLIDIARSMGCKDVQLIDIGGGIPGGSGYKIDEFIDTINEALEDIDSSINIISEPGRYYVTAAFTLATYLHGKKILTENDMAKRMYYVDEGVFGSFIEELLNVRIKARLPVSLTVSKVASDEKFSSTIWGPTCDSFDCIVKDSLLPEFQVGDWLVWKDMGAYTIALATTFNGFFPTTVYSIIRRSEWEAFWTDVTTAENVEK